MKKLLLVGLVVLLVVFSGTCVFAQPLDMGINAELGYLTEWKCYSMNMDVVLFINPNGIIRGTVYGGIEVLMDLHDMMYAFAPYQDTYKIGATFNVSVFYIKGEHYCTHPVISNLLAGWTDRGYAENCTKFSVGWQVNMPYKVTHRGR